MDKIQTLEEAQQFVYDNNISCAKQFSEKYKNVYNRVSKLRLRQNIIYVNDDIVTNKEDAQNCIDKYNISTINDLYNRYRKLYNNIKRIGVNPEQLLYHPKQKCWKQYDSIDKIQAFIINNNVVSIHDLELRYPGIFRKIKREYKDYYKIFTFKQQKNKWNFINSLDDINEYISSNNIHFSKDLPSGLIARMKKLCIKMDEINIQYVNKNYNKWSEYNNVEQIQQFINDNNIQTATQLKRLYHGLYKRLHTLPNKQDIQYPKKLLSVLEIQLKDFLKTHNIHFIQQKTFPQLKDKSYLRFDFYLPEFNLIIEPGGPQHLIDNISIKGHNNCLQTQIHDKQKYDFCKQNGINIIYYFDISQTGNKNKTKCFNRLKTFEGEYYITFNELTNRILDICKNDNKEECKSRIKEQ